MPFFTKVHFTKMHGCGNDFVIIDGDPPSRAEIVAIADRHTGVGCDQLIALARRPDSVFARFYNPDGSEAGACGNGTRCVASLVADGRDTIAVHTISGILPSRVLRDGRIAVDMGPPSLAAADIPLAHDADTLHLDLSLGDVRDPAAVSMGNPHVTFFVPDLDAVDVIGLGPTLEHAPIFPQRANVGFVQVMASHHVRLRVWERGAGLTRACGSGACAAVVNAARRGLTGREVSVAVDGGTLDILWRDSDNHVIMTGPVATSFRGTIDR